MSNGDRPWADAAQKPGLAEEPQALAANLMRGAKDKALDAVEQQKSSAAEQVDDVARLLDDVADTADHSVPAAAPYLRGAAASIHRTSSALRERGVDNVLQHVSRFARNRPAALIGACIVGGFALARFLKSSADRSSSMGRPSSRSQAPRNPSGSAPRTVAESVGRTQSSSAAPVADERSKAALGDARSPVAGMASISDVTPRTALTNHNSDVPGGSSPAEGLNRGTGAMHSEE